MEKIDGFQQLDAWQEAHAQKELLAQAETAGKILNGLIARTERRRAAPLIPTPYSILHTP
jgi:hypothetical protein